MRKVGWRWRVLLFLMLAGLFCPVKVHAEETDSYLDGLADEIQREVWMPRKLFSIMNGL